MLAEHSIVVLNSNLPDAGLHAGDVGAIVHVHGQGKAYEVEFVDGDGTTIALMTLSCRWDSSDRTRRTAAYPAPRPGRTKR